MKYAIALIIWCGVMSIYWIGKPNNPFKRNNPSIATQPVKDYIEIVPSYMATPGGFDTGLGLTVY